MSGWIGALVGVALALVETWLLLPRVIDKLKQTEADKSPATRAAFDRRVRLFRPIFLSINVIFGAMAGYTVGRLIGG